VKRGRPFVPLDDAATSRAVDEPAPLVVVRRRSSPGRLMLGLTLVAIVAALSGWFAARRFVTPDEAAAEGAAPLPSLMTAQVEYHPLTATIVARGDVSYPDAAAVQLEAPPGLAGAITVMTRVPVAGQTVHSGDVIAEVSYRPVIVLAGAVPAVRDLVRGDEGGDVTALQIALGELGLHEEEPTGEFDRPTQEAIARLYEAAGYEPIGGERSVRSIVLPRGEILYLAELPVQITQISVERGDLVEAGTTLATVTGSDLALTTYLPPGEAAEVDVGDPIDVYDEVTDRTLSAKVSAKAGRAGLDSEHPGLIRVDGVFDDPAPDLDGANVRVSISVEATQGSVLVVPLSAVTTTSGGGTTVEVLEPDGGHDLVGVELGLVADGLVEVRAVDGALEVGDQVVVGREYSRVG
jgi:hypothetical protein